MVTSMAIGAFCGFILAGFCNTAFNYYAPAHIHVRTEIIGVILGAALAAYIYTHA